MRGRCCHSLTATMDYWPERLTPTWCDVEQANVHTLFAQTTCVCSQPLSRYRQQPLWKQKIYSGIKQHLLVRSSRGHPRESTQLYQKSQETHHCPSECRLDETIPSNRTSGFRPIDTIGALIRTPRDHRYMLLITEHVTKPVKDISMKSLCTGEIAKLFVDKWVFNYAAPTELLSNNESKITSKLS